MKTAENIERQKTLLKGIEPGDDRENAEAKLKALQEEFDSGRKQAETEFGRREAESISNIHKKVLGIVAAISKQRDFSLVLNVDDSRMAVNDPQSITRVISNVVLFSTADLDITDEVLERLDRLP